MLSGIILQPGAWDETEGLLDDVLLANNTMHAVASPVTIWTKPGNPVGRITVAGLNATGVYRSALSIESWSDLPITNVVIRNASIEFAGGGKAEQAAQLVKGPGVDARPLPAWGIYARKVEKLTKTLRKQILKGLIALGMSRRQAEEALAADVRDLRVDIRSSLTQEALGRAFSNKEANAGEGTR